MNMRAQRLHRQTAKRLERTRLLRLTVAGAGAALISPLAFATAAPATPQIPAATSASEHTPATTTASGSGAAAATAEGDLRPRTPSIRAGAVRARAQDPAVAIDDYGNGRPREIALTDIGNEPDDQMSLVRQLLYANDIDLEGIVATTSTWKKNLDSGSTSIVEGVLDAYGQVHPNLVKHDKRYPSVRYLRSIFALGQKEYGLAGMGDGKELSRGARLIVSAVDKPDPRPLSVTIWGGANTLGQALNHVRKTRTQAELRAFVSKLRVYSISDQDDVGPVLRKQYPDLFYVVKPSLPDASNYSTATWTGVSGEHFNGALDFAGGDPSRLASVQRGPDSSLVTHAWLRQHIQSKGPLGAAYPDYMFIMEGDTPSWLGLIPNGLAGYANPGWGGWGGRYMFRKPADGEGPTVETRPFFTQGEGSADTVTGVDGNAWTEDFATVWRWRQAYQYEFSNRMDWTVKDYADANHAPSAVVNGTTGVAPLCVKVRPGTPVGLDASGSGDPDGDGLTFSWFHYREAGRTLQASSPGIKLSRDTGFRVTATPLGTGQAHVILTVTDNGGTALGEPFPSRSYRRVVLDVTKSAPRMPSPGPCGTQRKK